MRGKMSVLLLLSTFKRENGEVYTEKYLIILHTTLYSLTL